MATNFWVSRNSAPSWWHCFRVSSSELVPATHASLSPFCLILHSSFLVPGPAHCMRLRHSEFDGIIFDGAVWCRQQRHNWWQWNEATTPILVSLRIINSRPFLWLLVNDNESLAHLAGFSVDRYGDDYMEDLQTNKTWLAFHISTKTVFNELTSAKSTKKKLV